VHLWNTATGKLLRSWPGFPGPVWAVTIAPDGKSMAAASGDAAAKTGSARLWDLPEIKLDSAPMPEPTETPKDPTKEAPKDPTKEARELKGHQLPVTAVAITPDGKTIISGGDDWMVRVWDPATSKESQKPKNIMSKVAALALAPDGKSLAATD